MMRIEWVTAVAFGGLTEMTLDLGDGLTVVAGPNGSGKSTWHAAMYAGLCGQPSPAAQTEADHTFEELHAPWDGTDWLVDMKLALDDGSTVTISQDLRSRGPSTAVKRLRADSSEHDVSAGVRLGSTIDVSSWLGLDRRSFAATSWVEQALVRVADTADGRNELERAVATCIGDDEADQAEARIAEARRRIDSAGRMAWAAAEVERQREQTAYLHRQQRRQAQAAEALAQCRIQATTQRRRLRAAEAAAARAEVNELREQARALRDRTAELMGSIASPYPGYGNPGYAQPSFGAVVEDTEVHPSVAAAEQAWRALQQDMAAAEAAAPPAAHRTSTVDQNLTATQHQPVVATTSPGPWRGAPPSTRSLQVMCAGGIALAVTGVILGTVLGPFVGYGLAMAGVAFAVVALASLRRDRASTPLVAPSSPTPPSPTPPPSASGPPGPAPAMSSIAGPVSVEKLRWKLDQARQRLADALTARGCQADPANAPVVLAEYRMGCAERAAAPQRLRAELDECQERLASAEQKAEERSEGVDQMLMITLWKVDLDAERLACAQADSAVAAAEVDMADRAREIADLRRHGDPEAALEAAQHQADRWRLLDTTLGQAQTYLAQARTTRRRDITDRIRQELDAYLPEITNDRFLTVEVDGQLHTLLGESGHDVRKPMRGPHSTVDQSCLFTRIALGRHVATGREAGPLLLDDITSGADEKRVAKLLEVLLRIAQRRQVVVFAHDSATRDWAVGRMPSSPWLHLRILRDVTEPPCIHHGNPTDCQP